MNIYDISKQAGVSIRNGFPGFKRQRQGKAPPPGEGSEGHGTKQLRQTPLRAAWGWNSMHTVGILCADSSDVYLASAIYYLERGALLSFLCFHALLYRLSAGREEKISSASAVTQCGCPVFVGSNFVGGY